MEGCEQFPDVSGRLAEVRKCDVFLGWTPHGTGWVVEVSTGELLQLACPEHKVEGETGGGVEVGVS